MFSAHVVFDDSGHRSSVRTRHRQASGHRRDAGTSPAAFVSQGEVFHTTVAPTSDEDLAAGRNNEITLTNHGSVQGVWVIFERSRDMLRYYQVAGRSERLLAGSRPGPSLPLTLPVEIRDRRGHERRPVKGNWTCSVCRTHSIGAEFGAFRVGVGQIDSAGSLGNGLTRRKAGQDIALHFVLVNYLLPTLGISTHSAWIQSSFLPKAAFDPSPYPGRQR